VVLRLLSGATNQTKHRAISHIDIQRESTDSTVIRNPIEIPPSIAAAERTRHLAIGSPREAWNLEVAVAWNQDHRDGPSMDPWASGLTLRHRMPGPMGSPPMAVHGCH